MNTIPQESEAMERARDWTGYSGPLHTLKPEERRAMERAAKLAGKQTWWFEQMRRKENLKLAEYVAKAEKLKSGKCE